MPIDPAARALIEAMATGFPKLHEMPSGTEARRRIVEAMHDVEPDREPVHHVEDRAIAVDGGEIAVRIYRPSDDCDLPVVVFFHGRLGAVRSRLARCHGAAHGEHEWLHRRRHRLPPRS